MHALLVPLLLIRLAAPFGRLRGNQGLPEIGDKGTSYLTDAELAGCIDARKECKHWSTDGECDNNVCSHMPIEREKKYFLSL